MTLSEFVRLFPLRAKNLVWFFGAGTSVSSGLPSANDLVWEFKRRIYCSEESYQLSLFNNLSDPALRAQIQAYFDSKNNYPEINSVEEYSFYFELAFPAAIDRSNYLMKQLQGMQNSYGHKVVGTLIKNGLIPLIFTTNFDKAFENAAIEELKTMDKFFVATTDNTTTALQKYHSNLRPFITKLHGDYFSEKLKNTSQELNSQDEKLREILYHSCISNGLAVMGYSGRDYSVMEIFNKALDQTISYPHGIFWFIRPGTVILKAVSDFIERAKGKGIQAELIEIETFDTGWADIIKGINNLSNEDLAKLNTNYYKRDNIQLPEVGKNYPIVRFNTIRILEIPTNARLLKCNAGNTKDIVECIEKGNSSIIAIRKQAGIVGFGSDEEFEKVFSIYGVLQKDVYLIPDYHLGHDDSTIKGLLTESLLKALVKNRPLKFIKRKNRYLIIPDPKRINENIFGKLNTELDNQLIRTVPNTNIKCIAAIEIVLQKKLSNSFLLISPTFLATKTENVEDRFLVSPFLKEIMARWYNKKYANVLEGWLDIIFQDKKDLSVSVFDNNIIGYNASFKLKRESAYTKTI